ncbi:MAG: T9SS type A sorting domain-containing protein [Candidatus Neomarinimicrobiota bacterium]|nr:T9SS type A sorting domain-containing protein [Candidatus Neomarinimicrobiota bacterium]
MVSELQSVTGSTIVIPEDYALHPSYPNPFNPITNINYSLPIDTKVKLEVYNINGELINTLYNGIKTAGNHSIEWNAEVYPSGVYFVKLNAEEFTQTQKLMLIK